MKNIIFTTLFVICSLLSSFAQKSVAVYVSGNQDEEIKQYLGQKVVTYITQSQDYQAIERTRDFLNALKSEQDYQLSGEVSLEQIVDLGNQFGAQYVAAVKVSKIFGELVVAARLIDVESATVKESYESSGAVNTMQALTKLANDIADGLILASKRKEQAAIEAEKEKLIAEQRKIQEQEELEQLREVAIDNLTPSGCRICGNIMYMTSLVPAYLTPSGNQLYINVSIPYGFQMASLSEITELYNNGVRWNDDILFNKGIREERTRGGCRDWYVNTFSGGSAGSHLAASTVWQKKLVFEFNTTLHVLAIKSAPSESQIQAEINRLRNRR